MAQSITKKFPDRLWLQASLLSLVLMVPIGAAYLLEIRTFQDINVWIKPLKFHLSTFVHLATLFLAARLMRDEDRTKPVLIVLIWASIIASLLELVIITLRAGQAQASHYNFSTPLDALIYALMGFGALTMIMPAIYLGLRFFRSGEHFSGGNGLKAGIAYGFTFGTLLTLVFAGYMSSSGSHWVAGPASDANGLPLVGWVKDGGDLRVAHFFSLHLMQILPVIGLIADRAFDQKAKLSVWIIRLSFLTGAAFSAWTFIQALDGQAFIG